jgi:hypothetical protein
MKKHINININILNSIVNCQLSIVNYILVFLFCSATLSAQQSKHEFSVVGAGGLSTLVYNTAQSHRTPGAGATVGLGYEYYFTERWSIGTGAEFSWLNTKNITYSITDHYGATDNENENFDFRYTFSNYRERQRVNLLSIPVMGYFHTGKNYPLYVGLGGKIGLPVQASYSGSSESLVTKGYYPSHNALIENPASRGFGTYNNVSGSGNLKLKPAFMLSAEVGTVFSFGKEKKFKLYAGFYADYGLNNQLKGSRSPIEYHAANPAADYNHHSMLAGADGQGKAYTNKVAPLFAGVRVKFTFGKSKKTTPNTHTGAGQYIPERVHDSLIFVHDTIIIREVLRDTIIIHDTLDLRTIGEKEGLEYIKQHKPDIIWFTEVSNTKLHPSEAAKLDAFAEQLKSNPQTQLIIEGHTSDEGTQKINHRLGQQRAETVKAYLCKKGVSPKRISLVNKEDKQPLLPNTSEENRQKNRRAEMKIAE